MNKEIEQAITVIREGGIVIFPTDTAFGIGCRIDLKASVKKLFKLRKRSETKATPVLVDTVTMAQKYVEPISKEVIDKLIEPYWPGALTIVLQSRTDNVPSLVRGGGDTLGVRIPNHATARTLIREVGIPILGTSANFAGEQTPYSYEDLNPELVTLVDYVVPGVCTIKQASTVIDCSVFPWRVVRQGAVELNDL